MSRARKSILWFAGGFAAFLILSTASAILLPRLVHLDSIKETILKTISGAARCEVGCSNIDILLFPRPRIVLQNTSLSAPGKYSVSVGSVTALPRIIPLFIGKIQLDRLILETARADIVLPEVSGTPKVTETSETSRDEPSKRTPLEALEQRLAPLLEPVISDVPGLVVIIDNASLRLFRKTGDPFQFENLRARIELPPSRIKVDLGCKSNLWGNMELNAQLDPSNFKSEGRIILTDLRPRPLTSYLFPAFFKNVGGSRLNLDVSFKGRSQTEIEAEFHGSIPSLDLQGGNQEFVIQCEAIDGTLGLKGQKTEIAVSRLKLNYPQLSLRGKFMMDSSTPAASLKVESRDTDADAVRKVALAVAGENRTIRKIFNVVRGGRVPLITYSASASTPEKFGKPQHFIIKGNMVQGKIFIPKVDLDISDASGEVVISNGILEGKGLQGQTAGSRGRDCLLKIGLMHTMTLDPPFHLDIDIDADLAELQPVLERVVKNEPFQRELGLIGNVKGRAQGRLILGESLKHVKTRVEVRELNLSGSYERLPLPVELRCGPFLFESTRIALGPMSGKMGKSTFSGLFLNIDWGNPSKLDIATKDQSAISLDEIYPWLVSNGYGTKSLKDIETASGTLAIDELEIAGPLHASTDRRLRARGSLVDIAAKARALPFPVSIKSGRFSALQNRLSLEGLNATFSDSSMIVSGNLDGYLEGIENTDLALEATIGPNSGQWLFDFIHLPAKYRPKTPLSLARARLGRTKDGRISFSSNISVQNGPKASIDLRKTPDELAISRLAIKDQSSDAALTINIREREVDLGFSGTLGNKSLDSLLLKNEILAGWIKGNFSSHILLDQPMNSTATGELEAAGFTYSWKPLKGPILIENARLGAKDNRLDIQSASLNWQESHADLKGSVDFSQTGFRVDMDLAIDKLNWEQLKQDKGEQEEPGANEDKDPPSDKRRPWNERLQGVVRIQAQSFTYGKLTWTPLGATVTLSPDLFDIKLSEANLCGISTPGTIKISPHSIQLDLRPAAVKQEVDPAVTCFLNKKGLMNGTFNLAGELTTGRDTQDELLPAIKGKLALSAQKGRIYRFGLLSKIFSVLNVTEIYRGRFPDLVDKGFAYDSIKAKGTFKDGKLILSESIIDGPSMKMVWHGDLDLVKKELDLTGLIAPLRTVDRIIGKIPLVSDILGGKLISFPVRVSGDMNDPEVVPLSPSAVGSELLEYFKHTFKLPLKLMEPLF